MYVSIYFAIRDGNASSTVRESNVLFVILFFTYIRMYIYIYMYIYMCTHMYTYIRIDIFYNMLLPIYTFILQ